MLTKREVIQHLEQSLAAMEQGNWLQRWWNSTARRLISDTLTLVKSIDMPPCDHHEYKLSHRSRQISYPVLKRESSFTIYRERETVSIYYDNVLVVTYQEEGNERQNVFDAFTFMAMYSSQLADANVRLSEALAYATEGLSHAQASLSCRNVSNAMVDVALEHARQTMEDLDISTYHGDSNDV